MSKEAEPIVMFKHLRTMEKSRPAPTICNIGNFTLEQVASYNIHIDTGNTKTPSVITLHEVPGFLIEAFSKFQQLEGCKAEGIFRKDGNSLRCKEDPMPVFFGAKIFSPNFLVHDVCSWIKKFFRELRQPIFVTQETNLLQFAEYLRGDDLFGALILLLDKLPPSHMGTLGYLMRCLLEIAESAHLHQMTVENLATVFAPSLFRGVSEKETKKKRNGSQDDLLRALKRNNDLQVKVVKVLIENAAKIGAPTDCYRAASSASDAKIKERKLIASCNALASASKPPTSGTYMKINSAILKKNSRSTTNLASEPLTSSQRNSDDDTLNNPKKAKEQRSNSVVRMAFKSFKKSLTNLTSDAFMSTPDPPELANNKIPKPICHQQTPITQSISMDPSTTASSDDALSDIARRKHPEYSGVNMQEIRKVMSPKDSKKRPPIPNFDNRSSSTDEKKENEQEDENAAKKSIILRKRSSSGSRKPLGEINIHDEIFDGKERDMILNSTSNDDCHFSEVGHPSIAQIQGAGVVSRRIQHYKKLSNNSSKFPTTRGISGNDPKFAKPKPASHSVLWKKTNVNDTNPEQPTKSQNFGSSRAKSVTSMYSAIRTVFDSVRPSVSATSQISPPRIKKN